MKSQDQYYVSTHGKRISIHTTAGADTPSCPTIYLDRAMATAMALQILAEVRKLEEKYPENFLIPISRTSCLFF